MVSYLCHKSGQNRIEIGQIFILPNVVKNGLKSMSKIGAKSLHFFDTILF